MTAPFVLAGAAEMLPWGLWRLWRGLAGQCGTMRQISAGLTRRRYSARSCF